jgi:hypothetical protein
LYYYQQRSLAYQQLMSPSVLSKGIPKSTP